MKKMKRTAILNLPNRVNSERDKEKRKKLEIFDVESTAGRRGGSCC